MKFLLAICILVISFSCKAQSFFKPLPKIHEAARVGLASDSVLNSFRPVVGVTAIVSGTTALAGGFGIGFQHNKWDIPSQSWVTQYSISAIGFLGSDATKITGTAGLVVGFLNFISLGGGYDFTNKKFVLLTGVQLHFN